MRIIGITSVVVLAFAAAQALALPSLQLGPSGTGWDYCTTDCVVGEDTWIYSADGTATVAAYANGDPSDISGVSGSYAWDDGDTNRWAYIVLSAVPDTPEVPNPFILTVENDGASLTEFTSGYGTPPIEDPNSIAPHGIFATYFEIYEFQFDGSLGTIFNTTTACADPACDPGSGLGYTELFDITINSILDGVSGIHIDLFTVSGGRWDQPLGSFVDKKMVQAVAPYSHDAEISVPEPGSLALLGAGLLALGLVRRVRRKS